ncbi:hypothetical protein BpHYR1_051684 [Brachionus plicatilis]|uniref:Uncharacterized protein n=1 Tax=Brachionus plicatilis TaxID=10195 RepID=A0A3M7SQL4_BRAPC|nr:hypothetical protein BpHYR1_051684 [Brachionus plicatilis]
MTSFKEYMSRLMKEIIDTRKNVTYNIFAGIFSHVLKKPTKDLFKYTIHLAILFLALDTICSDCLKIKKTI